jgi:hypothetical protein
MVLARIDCGAPNDCFPIFQWPVRDAVVDWIGSIFPVEYLLRVCGRNQIDAPSTQVGGRFRKIAGRGPPAAHDAM